MPHSRSKCRSRRKVRRVKALLLSFVLAGGLVLGACTSPAPPATPSATSSQAVRLIEVAVKDRKVIPPPGRVEIAKGQEVRLVVRSDTPDRVHVHGYDIEKMVSPGRDAVIEFTADRTGVFDVETHQSKLLLTQLVVR
jgi:hypothetical protein